MAGHIGEQFGNYRLIQLLGQGGFAEVYLGEHIHLNTQAAIKLLHRRLADKDVEQFRDEARLLAHLDHPHIVKVLDFGIQNNIPFLVMTYAPNGTLRQNHPQGISIPLITVVTYINQIVSALQYAHFRKHVHRDMKPQNILVGPDRRLLLSDFGISIAAHDFHSLTPQIALGTPPYMAPEQFQGKALRASDQYSLGVMVYEWLCGELPFTGDLFSLMNQHATKPPPSLREKNSLISVEMENVILKALEKNPENRFPNVQAFADALEAASKKRPVGTTLMTYRGHSGRVTTITWSPDGKRIASASEDVQVWEVAAEQRIFTWVGTERASGGRIIPNVVAWSPDGERIAIGTENDAVIICDAIRGEQVSRYVRGRFQGGMAWSPDGKYIASGLDGISTRFPSGSYMTGGRAVDVWEVDTLSSIASCTPYNWKRPRAIGWSPDSKQIVIVMGGYVSEGSSYATIYDAMTGNQISQHYSPHPASNIITPRFHALKWISIGVRVASIINQNKVSGKVCVWDAVTGDMILTYNTPEGIYVGAVAWSSDGKYIASGGTDNAVTIWEAASGQIAGTYTGHTDAITAIAWSPDGQRIASGSKDGTVQVWQATDQAYPKEKARLLLENGDNFYKNRKYSEALAAYEEAIKLEPTNGLAFLKKVLVLGSLDREEEANLAFNEAVKLEPAIEYLFGSSISDISDGYVFDDYGPLALADKFDSYERALKRSSTRTTEDIIYQIRWAEYRKRHVQPL